MRYVLDRGHGLQAPCDESGSDCGFSAGFAGLQIHDSRRSRGNVGIPAGISKGCGKGGKPLHGFPCFPYPGISMACFCLAKKYWLPFGTAGSSKLSGCSSCAKTRTDNPNLGAKRAQ